MRNWDLKTARVAREPEILFTPKGRPSTARIEVRLRPHGRRDELIGLRDGIVQARVTAPPVDGRANRALCRLIAKRIGVAPSRVRVVHGERSRDKVVEVEGVSSATVERALS